MLELLGTTTECEDVEEALRLKIGDASGTAVLWDPAGKSALKMPRDKLRIIPVGEPSKSCAPSA
ncbi:hypothetical protein [Streptomyces cyaneofuscatus]|uniref:hypothetical protein n=1 Tax=Streptomyces cyaneofuscatus TaxID=66883 RepID=UPI0033A50816